MLLKSPFLDTCIFCKGRSFNSASFSRMALFSSSMLKKVWFPGGAMMQRSAMSTADCSLALSPGLAARAGMMVVP